MTRQLLVFVDGVRAGVLGCDVRSSTFRYDRPYLARRTPTPLSLSLPVGPREYGPEAVEPFLWGLLPDNAETLRRWALDARPQADEHNPFTLLQHYGLDCAGAVQFVRPENEATFERHGGLSRLSDTQIGAQIRAMNADPSRWTFDDRDGRFSLGGAQAKFGLLREDDAWALPTGATPTTHIVKPGIPEFRGSAVNEHVCLTLAARLGLVAARSRIDRFDGETAVVVERYDRLRLAEARPPERSARGLRRIHQEDFCQALSVMPSQKYEDDGGPGLGRMAALLRRQLPRDEAQRAIERLLLGVAFNWLIAAPDAHAKNYSVLLSGRQIALAPLYDIATLTPYDRYRPERMRLAQKVAGTYRPAEIGGLGWRTEAAARDLDPDRFGDRITELVAAAPDHIRALCSDPALRAMDPEFVDDLRAALLDRVAAAAAALR
ncbi:serine/threonine-protein kinase HipA [Rathayibacter sp. PhB127]|uniref:type II toxin-antitoxin system HipA family toxin n=1 Tax=Rathayibacter sp. PhB127 TaxID=2485176 RepID=UPI000FC19720|nr:type II toxin-antitoxin system HipA family toxin [Rathayibacter sp. PhB127]ROS21938.1 serine/threonine-protein kinase HipA [Rathayibacter sp. PhB127]